MSNNIAELVGTISDAVELEGGIVALRGLKGEKGEKGDPSDAALEGVQVPYGDDNEWQDVSVVQKKARIPVASSTENGVTSIERYGSEVDIAHGNNDPAYGLGAQHYSLPLVMHDVEGYEEGTIDPNLIPSSVFAKHNVYTAKAYLGRVDLTNYSATIQDYEFSGEMLLVVRFTSISTTPTGWSLNVNNSGSKAIYYNGSNSVDFTKLITTDSLVGLVKDPDNIGFAIAFISYELNRKQDTLTATSPIDIDANNNISHEDSGVVAGTYKPYSLAKGALTFRTFSIDAKGHITNTGVDAVTYSNVDHYTDGIGFVSNEGWSCVIRAYNKRWRQDAYILSAGQTSLTIPITDVRGTNENFCKVVDVAARDVVTCEPVIVDWKTDAMSKFSSASPHNLIVSIATPYEHNISITPTVMYDNGSVM